MNRVLVFLLLVVFAFTSCDPSRHFEENKEIPKMEWDKDVPLSFLVSVNDTSLGYNVYINVRNAGFYRFSNLYLFVNTTFPQGQVHRDTVECILASPEGRWLGEGLGDIWDNRILFKENVQFTQPGEYRFELNQAMRINPLPGIMDAGIRIEKVD